MFIQHNIPLGPLTTLGVGGAALFFARVEDEPSLLEAVHFARARKLPIFALGGGSNLLISDAGFVGLVLHLAISAPTRRDDSLFHVAAGTDWDAFVLSICEQGISGVECLAGIPGLVGGSPIQNIGAYGQEVSSTIDTVRVLDLESLGFVTLSHEACSFSYRRSLFNSSHRGRYLVTAVTFRFDADAKLNLAYADLQRHFAYRPTPSPLDIYHAVRSIRQAKGMLLVPGDPDSRSAGSFFKNPIVSSLVLANLAHALHVDDSVIPHWPAEQGSIKLAAAWLVERAGFPKGFILGPAGISSRHTLALTNRGGATFADIARLRDTIQREVQTRFGIALEQEPVQLGL